MRNQSGASVTHVKYTNLPLPIIRPYFIHISVWEMKSAEAWPAVEAIIPGTCSIIFIYFDVYYIP